MNREHIGRIGVVLALAALVAWAFWQRWQVLTGSPYPLGVDGYFYPIEVRALLEHGTLQYPASPLTFWFMAPLAAATDPITGAKLGAALGGALVAVPAYGIGARFGRGRGAGLVAAAVAATSASSQYLSYEFVKQGIGLTVALTAVWLLLRALETPSKPRIAAAVAGLVATLLAHKLAAGVVLLIAIPAAINEARGRAVWRGRRLLYRVAALVAGALAVLVVGLAYPEAFLSPHDAGLLGGLFAREAHGSLPALATPHLMLAFGHEAVFAAVISVAAAAALYIHRPRPHRHGERTAMWIVVGIGVVIAIPWLAVSDPQGLGFRLRVAAFVPLALGGAIVVAAALDKVKPLTRDAALAVLALLLAIRPHADPSEGVVPAHPALVAAVMASTTQIPAGATVIVPERHILFMVAWYARVTVTLEPDRVLFPERVRMLPLSFIGMDTPLDRALDAARAKPSIAPPIGLHPGHRNGLVLVTEPTWHWLLAHVPADGYWARWPTI